MRPPSKRAGGGDVAAIVVVMVERFIQLQVERMLCVGSRGVERMVYVS
jgi:hypothetical protein